MKNKLLIISILFCIRATVTMPIPFLAIFDIGYGKAICQFLDAKDINTMYCVNNTCAKIVVKFLEKKEIIFSVDQTGICTFKHQNMRRARTTKYPLHRFLFGYSDLNTILHHMTIITKNDIIPISQVPIDDWIFLRIKYIDYRIKCLRYELENQRRIAAAEAAVIQEKKEFMLYTLKPKVWGKQKI